MKQTITTMIMTCLIALIVLTGCASKEAQVQDTPPADMQAEAPEETAKPYSEVLEQRIANAGVETAVNSVRPDYLPAEMFSRLPPMPDDFYQVRTLVRAGRISDLEIFGPEYWQQPEFFPHFEDIGVPLLQNPPKNRWGAYGIAVFPADSVGTIVAGDSLDFNFFIKSNYLVETYQGVNLAVVTPEKAKITTGVELPDGSKSIEQDPEVIKDHFTVEVTPNPFILEPNFPIYNINGTRKITMKVSTKKDTPPGNYMIGLDTGAVPQDKENEWTMKYLNLYTSGGMTKIERPYYQAFITVVRGEE